MAASFDSGGSLLTNHLVTTVFPDVGPDPEGTPSDGKWWGIYVH
jgi:hypothetical protein